MEDENRIEDEYEDELTEQMIKSVQALKEQFQSTLQQIDAAHQKEIQTKDARISELSSEVSTLKSELRKLAEKNEKLNSADLIVRENAKLKDENKRLDAIIDHVNKDIVDLVNNALDTTAGAKILIKDLKGYTEAVERSNEAVRVELSEATEKAAQGLLEPITATHKTQLEEIVKKSDETFFALIFTKWILIGVLLISLVVSGFAAYKMYDTREALGRVGTVENQILQMEKARYKAEYPDLYKKLYPNEK